MQRRTTTLLVSGGLAVVLGVFGLSLPVPYVKLVPGPTSNTLGSQDGNELITITGAPHIYPTTGQLKLVTVGEYGGPGQGDLKLGDILGGFFDRNVAVIPSAVLFPEGKTGSEVKQQNTVEMVNSQEDAKNAALRYLGFDLKPAVYVYSVVEGSGADGVLDKGDYITAIDGESATSSDQLLAALKKHTPGDTVAVTIVRDGKTRDVKVDTSRSQGDDDRATLGVTVSDDFLRPFDIEIHLDDVGGPSAGMMFTLGIIDKLTPDNLTGGKTIAGTGTIDVDGKVGPIGGVQQKMAGAKRDGATVFLVPAGNCGDAVKAKPAGLRLVKVDTLRDAVSSLETLRDGGTDVPTC